MGPYTLGQYISAVNSQISRNRSAFLLNAPLWWKNGPWHIDSTQVNWQCQVTISGNSSWFGFLPTTSPFLNRFRWLSPHFEGNHNIFLSDTILLKTQKFKIFMNMPTPVDNAMYRIGIHGSSTVLFWMVLHYWKARVFNSFVPSRSMIGLAHDLHCYQSWVHSVY